MTLLVVSAINDSSKIKVKLFLFMIDALDQGVWSLHHHRKMSADKNSNAKDCWQAGCCKVRPKVLPGPAIPGVTCRGGRETLFPDTLVGSDQPGQGG